MKLTEEQKKVRYALIARFQKWLDTEPDPAIIAIECANIAEAYHAQQSTSLKSVIEFGCWLTGHDEKTIEQMFNDFKIKRV